jgi:hypothetical protein
VFGSRSGRRGDQPGAVLLWPASIGLSVMLSGRERPLVLVATPSTELAERLMCDVRRTGSIACLARTADGCLRVATSVGPDVLLLDSRLPDRLVDMLRSHPATASSTILRVSEAGSRNAAENPLTDPFGCDRRVPRASLLERSSALSAELPSWAARAAAELAGYPPARASSLLAHQVPAILRRVARAAQR